MNLKKTALLSTAAVLMMSAPAIAKDMQETAAAGPLNFAELDLNKDGAVSEGEFLTLTSIEDAQEVFTATDENSDGSLDQIEIDRYNQAHAEGVEPSAGTPEEVSPAQ